MIMPIFTEIKKNKITGFTIVELLVVIAIIGILSVISIVSFSRVQSESRDSQRSSKITVIAEALEKYYEKNGEYPSCSDMSQPASTISSSTLKGIDPNALTTPTATTGSNSILPSCANLVAGSTTDAFAYVGDSSAACLAGVDCSHYTLKYREESTGNIVTIASRRNNDGIDNPNSVVATVNSPTQITVTWDSVLKANTYNIEVAQNSSFTGSSFTNGLTSTSSVFSGLSQGQKYYFRVYAVSNSTPGLPSAATDAITNINAPAVTPIIATPASTVGATTTWSWNAATCAAGTTASYQYTYYTSAGYNSGWTATAAASFAATTSTTGYTYSLFVQARCYTVNVSSAWTTTSNTVSYYRPMTAQAAPVITVTLSGANVLATISPAVTCASGTIQYGIRSRINDGAWGAYSAWSSTTTATQVANDGVKYGYQAQDQCYIDVNNAPSATVTGVESTYTDPIATPAAPTVAANTVAATTTWSWNTPTCTVGTVRYQYRYTISPSGYDSGLVATVGLSVAFTTSIEGYTYTVAVQSQCYNANATSSWSTAGTANYSRVRTWTQISASFEHTCAIASNGLAYCWGLNDGGELGNNSTINSSVPSPVNTSGVLSGKTIKFIAAGRRHTCAVASDDLAYCWGYNGNGSGGGLGNNSVASSLVPVAVYTGGVLSGKTIKFITAGTDRTCAIASDNQAYCWGSNSGGSLGNNSYTVTSVPVAVYTAGVLSGKTVRSIAAGMWYTCAIASDNQAYCWGYAGFGGLGNNSTATAYVPVAVYTAGVLSGKTLVGAIMVGQDNTFAIASDNQAYSWGINGSQGRLGNNSTTHSYVPVGVYTAGVLSGLTIKSITAARDHACVIASNNQIYCWGYNVYGQLGNNSTVDSLIPVTMFSGPY